MDKPNHVRKWYNSARWGRLRRNQLSKEPLCMCPHCKGSALPANVVDHVIAHRGNSRLFFDSKNLQSMNKECHDRYKQSQEKGGKGFDQGCDINGSPLNADHHWNTKDKLH